MKYLLTFFPATLLLTLLLFTACGDGADQPPDQVLESSDKSILIFSKTEGWRHESIEVGQSAIAEMALDNGVAVTTTEEAGYFTAGNLALHDVVIFLNTTETIFEDEQREAFKEYIQNGGGFVGIHSAADTEYDWPWYGELVGAYFESHPSDPNVREATIFVEDSNHLSTEMLPNEWERSDEWYNFQELPDHTNILLTLDTDSYEGSEHPGNHPVAWYHDYDGGRAFYTALGHTEASYSEDLFLQHIWGGIQYAMGIKE